MKRIVSIVLSVMLIGSFFTACSNGAKEFINAETHFAFASQKSTDAIQTIIYGGGVDNPGDYFIPIFQLKEPVDLHVEIVPSLLMEKAKKLNKKQKGTDLSIPVEIVITKESKNIEVSNIGGLLNTTMESDIEGNATYSFFIKNNPALHPHLTFRFTPAEKGKAEIRIKYGPVVDSTCNVFQTLDFVE